MQKALIKISILAVIITLASCSRSGRLYPLDNSSRAKPVLTVHFKGYMAYGGTDGEADIIIPGGEVLKGKYTYIRGSMKGFGSIYSKIFPYAYPTWSVYGSGGAYGIITASNNSDTEIGCEFFHNFTATIGGGDAGARGVCESSKGQVYRLEF